MTAAFYDAVRSSLFGGKLTQDQVEALEAICTAWSRYGDGDKAKLAYLFATAFHETARFKHLREIWGPTAQQKKYEGRADLGNTVKGDGKRYMGRGLVQITGRRNYADWSKRLSVDLIAHPEFAEDLRYAARILVEGTMLGTFTGKKLGDYIKPGVSDYVNARRTVNGLDKADLIAGYARKFLAALGPVSEPAKPSLPIDLPDEFDPPASEPRKGIPGWLVVAGLAIAGVAALALFTPIF